MCGEEYLTLFKSDTEDEDFYGFSAQEEDEDDCQWLYQYVFFFKPALLVLCYLVAVPLLPRLSNFYLYGFFFNQPC